MRVGFFDTEADGLLPDITRFWCAHVKVKDSDEEASFTPETIDQLPAYLDTFDVLIGHNCIGYDFPALRKIYGYEYRGVMVDTLLMSRLQRPNRLAPRGSTSGPHSVEAWGMRFGQHKQVHEDWSVFSSAMLDRCVSDVSIQERIYAYLLKEGQGEGWTEAHKLNHKVHYYLQRQEEYGWLVDQEHMAKCLHFLNHWIDRIDRALQTRLPLVVEVGETKKDGEYGWVKKPFKKDGAYAEIVVRFLEELGGGLPSSNDDNMLSDSRHSVLPNDRSSMVVCGPFSRVSFRPVDLDKNTEIKTMLLDAGWEPKEWNTNNAGERTSPKLSKDDPFEGVQGSFGRLLARRIQCKQRRGTIQGWQEGIRLDGRIGAKVSGLAVTGRLRHAVIVNVPGGEAFFGKWMRSIFIARPGWVLVGVDSKGNQMRQLAGHMGDDEFTEAVIHGDKEKGTDEHSVTQRKCGLPTRHVAKTLNYGVIFGAGDAKAGKIVGKGAEEGARLKRLLFDGLPGLESLIQSLQEQFRNTAQKWYNKKWGRMEYKNGWIKGLDGRPIQVDSEHKVLVSLLQSDEAIQMAAAYVIFHKWMERAGYRLHEDWGMCIWMHDEFQFECKPEIKEHAAALACESIAWAGRFFGIKCPHEGEAKMGLNWMETH